MTISAEVIHGAAIWANTGGPVWFGGCRINALGFAVQCCHETGWFASRPMNAHNNYAGISCTRSWVEKGGRCFTAQTWEHLDGQDQTLVKGFRSYPSLKDFMTDYSRLICLYYPLAAANDDCVWLYLAGLVHGKGGRKWATDPLYFEKLVRMAVQLAPALVGDRWGRSWRQTLQNSFTAAQNRGLPTPHIKEVIADALACA